jgi:hypothetical protein
MAKSKTSLQNQTVTKVFMYLSLLAAVLLFVAGGLAMWAHTFTSNMVRAELAAQKIYFPEEGSPALDPATYPNLQQYAGQLVDTPEEAKAYANGYIGQHLKKVADGKVYAEVSTESMKDPSNQKLQQQKQRLFQGETLRGILLTSGYGFGTIGKIAGMAAYIAFAASGALLLVAAFLRRRI